MMIYDLIPRGAVLDAIGYGPRECKICKAQIDKIPAVDAAPVIHIHWVKEKDRDFQWHCSACKRVVGISAFTYNYCPSCGGIVDEEETHD